MKVTYTATAADGRTFTRKSERTYTHAAIITTPYRVVVKFSGSRDLAVKAGNSLLAPARWMRPGMEEYDRLMTIQAATTVEIVEVTA